MRTTHTFTVLKIPAAAWDAILAEIRKVDDGLPEPTLGQPTYEQEYLHNDVTIAFPGSEVALERDESLKFEDTSNSGSIRELNQLKKDALANREKEDPEEIDRRWTGYLEGIRASTHRLEMAGTLKDKPSVPSPPRPEPGTKTGGPKKP